MKTGILTRGSASTSSGSSTGSQSQWELLVGASRPCYPRCHADHVAVLAVYGLGQVDHAVPVEILEEDRVAVEDVVDVLVEEAAVVRRGVPVEAGLDGRQPVHHLLELGDLVGVQRSGEVGVSVILYASDSAGKVWLRFQLKRFCHFAPPKLPQDSPKGGRADDDTLPAKA